MIEFSGKFSEESKYYLLRKLAISGFIIFFVTSIFFNAIIITIAAILNFWIITWFCFAIVLLVIICATIGPFIYKEKILNEVIPKKINIDNEGFINIEFAKRSMLKSISDVKKIIDYGKWYYIIYHFPKESDSVCQKDLITKGTLEEFEKLFEGKIVRKIQNKKQKETE